MKSVSNNNLYVILASVSYLKSSRLAAALTTRSHSSYERPAVTPCTLKLRRHKKNVESGLQAEGAGSRQRCAVGSSQKTSVDMKGQTRHFAVQRG